MREVAAPLLLLLLLLARPAAAEETPPEATVEATTPALGDAVPVEDEEVAAAWVSQLPRLREMRERLGASASSQEVGAAAADALYDQVVEALATGRRELRTALEQGADMAEVDAIAHELTALNDVRISLLDRTSEEKRGRVLGLSREGIAQFLREVEHLNLVARWYPQARLREIERLPAHLHDLVLVGSASWTFLRMLVATLLALWIHRRHRAWLQALRQWLLSGPRNRGLRLSGARAINHVAGLGSELVVLGWLTVMRNLAGPDAPPEIRLLATVAIAWAWYRLARAALYRLIASAAVRSADLGAEQRRRVLRSLDLVGRYVLGVAVFLLLSAAILGRGYLHTIVVDFAWIGALPIGVALVRGWQDEITGAWIGAHPTGALTGWLERTRGTRRGVLPALAAAGSVVVRGGARWLRDTALRFDQTRSALAYLFRRRLERHAESVGRGLSEVEVLPATLRAAFTEAPIADQNLVVDRFPRLSEVEGLCTRLAAGGRGGTVALVGERGAGKSSWLLALAARAGDLPVTRHEFLARLTEPSQVHAALAEALGLEAADEEGLVEALRQGPTRLVLLDGCEHLVLRRVGGLAAADALLRIAGRTSDRVLWVCAFGRLAFTHLRSLNGGGALFRVVVQLAGWSEAELGQLVEKRMEAAGCAAVWDDLLVERLDGGMLETEVLRTSERYRRLLWDHAAGNPRVALHFWLRSLVPDGENRVRVRLFEAPSGAPLERLADPDRFLLGAVVLHGSLTAAEAAQTLRDPIADCEIRLAALESEGWLHADGGRYAPTTRWYREILRHLRRKHLIVA